MAENSILGSLLPLVVICVIFYFLVLRPQQKQAKAHKQMLSSLQSGDKIITTGGLICEVIKTEEDFIKVRLNKENTTAKISRDFIAKKIDA